LKEAFEMTDMVKKFELGTAALQQQGAKARGFNKGIEALNIAAMLERHGITFGGNEN
jgi:hypothetical protein